MRIVVFSWRSERKELDDDYEYMSHRVHNGGFYEYHYVYHYLEDFTRMSVVGCGGFSICE